MQPDPRRVAARWLLHRGNAGAIRYEAGRARGPNPLHVSAYDGDKLVGTMGLRYVDADSMKPKCREDYNLIMSELRYRKTGVYGEWATIITVPLEVFDVGVDDEYQRHGIGLQLYERALKLGKPDTTVLFASRCISSGSTSYDAERLWKRLTRKYLSHGFVVADARPE